MSEFFLDPELTAPVLTSKPAYNYSEVDYDIPFIKSYLKSKFETLNIYVIDSPFQLNCSSFIEQEMIYFVINISQYSGKHILKFNILSGSREISSKVLHMISDDTIPISGYGQPLGCADSRMNISEIDGETAFIKELISPESCYDMRLMALQTIASCARGLSYSENYGIDLFSPEGPWHNFVQNIVDIANNNLDNDEIYLVAISTLFEIFSVPHISLDKKSILNSIQKINSTKPHYQYHLSKQWEALDSL